MLNYIEYDKIIKECKEISILKNKQYGNESLKLFDGLAILCRMNDKIMRLNNCKGNHEDSIKDLINYSIYLLMLIRKKLE